MERGVRLPLVAPLLFLLSLQLGLLSAADPQKDAPRAAVKNSGKSAITNQVVNGANEKGSNVEKKKTVYAFDPDPALPNVLILGDSISMGYTLPARAVLKGKANVFRPEANCSNTKFGLSHIGEWLEMRPKWDVIHFNWGLHDLKHVKKVDGKLTTSPDPNDPPMFTLEEYRTNLELLVERLEKTGAKLIFATTTPVPVCKPMPPTSPGPFRAPADPPRYNAVALEVMKKHNIAIDDLYGFAMPQLGKLQIPENVHFTDTGSAALAGEVAKSISKALDAGK